MDGLRMGRRVGMSEKRKRLISNEEIGIRRDAA
jgi:hypothetical protein